MQYAQRTALLAMIDGLARQLETLKVLVTADVGEGPPRGEHRTFRAAARAPEGYTTDEEDAEIERRMGLRAQREIDREEAALRRMVDDSREAVNDGGDAPATAPGAE